MDPHGDQSKQNKRKEPTAEKFTIAFQVFRHQDQPYANHSLKLAKPYRPDWDKDVVPKRDYPDVFREKANPANRHGVYIMHNLNHKNILCMKAAGQTRLERGDEFSLFVEEYAGPLNVITFWPAVAEAFKHIPSSTFQNIIREIIEGVDFLWRNGTYHGNLSWLTTLYQRPYTVKLHGFRSKDLPLDKSQWGDVDGIIVMLEDVCNMAFQYNQDPKEEHNFFYGEVNALIDLLRTLDRNSLPVMRDVLEHLFFWTGGKRARFVMTDVSELLHDGEFIKEVNKSDIGSLDSALPGFLDQKYEALLEHCNEYRATLPQPIPNFNRSKPIGVVQLAYAAYTHRNQIMKTVQASVDHIMRAKFPKLFLELNRIVKSVRNSRAQRILQGGVGTSGVMDTGE
ncbi:unnamed protein product [Urochloa decumbens]|uniref:Uncharacterized protein n=1 Tax=Urochloa decumbens TaxID=240449 RepID=A0ABC8Y4Q8_9POAL